MHELGITMEIIDMISNQAAQYESSRVRRVVMEIGVLATVLPDSVKFCFDLCSEGTVVEGAKLEIVEIMGKGACQKCGRFIETQDPFVICTCGSMEIEWKTGHELKIRELEIDVEAPS